MQAGNVRTSDISQFINYELRNPLLSLPATATTILMFPNDFGRGDNGIELTSPRVPRGFNSNCAGQSRLRSGKLTWTLRNTELLEPALQTLPGNTAFLQVNVHLSISHLYLHHNYLTVSQR